MSVSLVKKSLELFRDDLETGKSGKKAKNPMKKISTNRKGVKKELRKIKHTEEERRRLKLNKKKTKSASYDLRKKRNTDHTDANLDYIQKLSNLGKSRSTSAEAIIKHSKKWKDISNGREEKPKEEKSILFSDKEFDKEEVKDNFWD